MDRKSIHIILDYGHVSNCPGKCSPDKSFFEWKFNREVGKKILQRLTDLGYNVHSTWDKDHEPNSTPNVMCNSKQLNNALNWRAREVNRLCALYGSQKCLSVSIHANAAGNSGWSNASGFSVFVGKTASANSKRLARLIYDEADSRGLRGNRSVPAGHYWTQGLAMCDSTVCPAVLTECMFYDNKGDLELLKTASGKQLIIEAHVAGIRKYIEQL